MHSQYGKAIVERVALSVFRVPTDLPESDGTLEWDATTLVLVELLADGVCGLGYTYAGQSSACLLREKLVDVVVGSDGLEVSRTWSSMVQSIRNLGRPGVASTAIAAVDIALWDLKARLLGLPLVRLLGQVRPSIPVYGSGGFTSYSIEQLTQQFGAWVSQGIQRVKMKIGRYPAQDEARVKLAREAIGPDVALFVDANGAYGRKQALAQAAAFGRYGVTWFEEPVSSDDLSGLRFLREHSPPTMDITAGEYGYDPVYFRRLLESQAVDVLQPDATRCAGITGFMAAATLAEAFGVPISAHTAPAVHLHPCCALTGARHLEYFHDHVRIEQRFFEGAVTPLQGQVAPDLSRPGLGLELKQAEARLFQIA